MGLTTLFVKTYIYLKNMVYSQENCHILHIRHVIRKKKSLKIADHLPRLAKRAELPSGRFVGRCEPPNFFKHFQLLKGNLGHLVKLIIDILSSFLVTFS